MRVGIKGFDKNTKKYIETLVKKSFDALKIKGEEYEYEFVKDKFDLCIVYKNFKSITKLSINVYMVLIIDDVLASSELKIIEKYPNIVGIFRKERLKDFSDLEECGDFAKTIKNVARQFHNKIERSDNVAITKKEILKSVSWKFKVDKNSDLYNNKKYISLFMDSSTKELSSNLLQIVKKLSDVYREFLVENKNILKEANRLTKKEKIEFSEIIKKCNKMTFERPLPTVLIQGETGTGKTLVTTYIAEKLKENCYDEMIGNYKDLNDYLYRFSLTNINKDLMDGLLFGYKEGSFTGADEDNLGIILKQIGKVLFIDEIGEISPDIQTKLLLYFDNMEISPLGFGKSIRSPEIVVCATNKDLKEEIKKGNFREDLYHRFMYKLTIPSLRERRSEIRFLISFILQNPMINKDLTIKKISISAIEKIENYDFPGNFRELEYVLSNAVQHALGDGRDYIILNDISL